MVESQLFVAAALSSNPSTSDYSFLPFAAALFAEKLTVGSVELESFYVLFVVELSTGVGIGCIKGVIIIQTYSPLKSQTTTYKGFVEVNFETKFLF